MKKPPIVELRNDYLYIKASGDRTSFKEIVEGTLDIYESAQKYQTKKVFGDYREVRFKVSITEAFNILRFYENKLPEFQGIAMCIVINPEDQKIANYWESIFVKRGYNVSVFKDITKAEEWLKQQ